MEKKIADPQGTLTRLTKLTTQKVKELVKSFIHDNPNYGYENAIKLLERQYGSPVKLLACYRNEIKRVKKNQITRWTCILGIIQFPYKISKPTK